MNILYTSDNEAPTLMTLDALLASFTVSAKMSKTDKWFYPDDIRDDLDGRGWYESVHDDGRFLILNLDKLQLTPTPEGWDGMYAKKVTA